MRLYHPPRLWQICLAFFALLVGCSPPQATPAMIRVDLAVDGQILQVDLLAGSSVQHALNQASIQLGALDRIDPPLYTLLTDGAQIEVLRVREEFTVEQEVIPFERQIVQTESLPEGDQLLAQGGVNGIREITYRHIFEAGIESGKEAVQGRVVVDPIPEILMVGVQRSFSPLEIPGRLAYLLGGNAWLMEETTINRRAVVTTGDLDGRVFTLSPDGKWLLYTRRSEEEGEINNLWAADLGTEPVKQFDLKIPNIVHFADWVRDGNNNKIIFSTVEYRQAAPGWQANNDLFQVSFSSVGWVSLWQQILDASAGGVYGWWGTEFYWSPDGERLAYARPDEIGLVDFENSTLIPLATIVPLQTRADWAWIPPLAWSPDNQFIYTVDHGIPPGAEKPEESQLFQLNVYPLNAGIPITLQQKVGMFAYPSPSPLQELPVGEQGYQLAYLQAHFPEQSETSSYRLAIMDRDGSNRITLFPADGQAGLEPQPIIWSPENMEKFGALGIAIIYQGNIWLLDSIGVDSAQQVTGDGLVSRISWQQSSGNGD